MKNLILTLVMASFAISVAQAQVKRQYRDQSQLETTVVVKDNNASASDIDILNSQFNMADVGMGDVIMITTERDRPQTQISAPAATVVETIAETPISTPTTLQAEVAIPTNNQTAQASNTIEAIPVQEYVKVEVANIEPVVQELANVPTAQVQRSTRTASSSNSAASIAKKAAAKKAYKKSKRGKRVNLKNRKKPSKRKKLRCYAF